MLLVLAFQFAAALTCEEWSNTGECESNKDFMDIHCRAWCLKVANVFRKTCDIHSGNAFEALPIAYGQRKTNFEVFNERSTPISVKLVNERGERTVYQVLEYGTHLKQDTWIGERWEVVDTLTQDVIRQFRAGLYVVQNWECAYSESGSGAGEKNIIESDVRNVTVVSNATFYTAIVSGDETMCILSPRSYCDITIRLNVKLNAVRIRDGKIMQVFRNENIDLIDGNAFYEVEAAVSLLGMIRSTFVAASDQYTVV